MESTTSPKQENKIKEKVENTKNEIMEFTHSMHAIGRIDKEQVDVMDAFMSGKVDYGTMRSMCG